MKRFVAPVVAWEISDPPMIPRGVSRSSADGLTSLMSVMPVNCPPVMLSTCPWTKFDHGEQRKKTPPAASSGVPGRPSGISIEAIAAHLVGDAELDLLAVDLHLVLVDLGRRSAASRSSRTRPR